MGPTRSTQPQYLSFDIPHSSFAILKVYDILGREVATLVNEEMHPGSYKVTWDAGGFASGVYFYRFRAGESVETKKLILVRRWQFLFLS